MANKMARMKTSHIVVVFAIWAVCYSSGYFFGRSTPVDQDSLLDMRSTALHTINQISPVPVGMDLQPIKPSQSDGGLSSSSPPAVSGGEIALTLQSLPKAQTGTSVSSQAAPAQTLTAKLCQIFGWRLHRQQQ